MNLWSPAAKRRAEWGVATCVYEIAFWGNENALELDGGDGCTAVTIGKPSELYPSIAEFYST